MYSGRAILFSGILIMQFLTDLLCGYPSLHYNFIIAKSYFSLLDFQTVSKPDQPRKGAVWSVV